MRQDNGQLPPSPLDPRNEQIDSLRTQLAEMTKERDKARLNLSAVSQSWTDSMVEYVELENKLLQSIIERDDAQQAASHFYYLVFGKSAEWSNLYGFDQAGEDVKDAVNGFRSHIQALTACQSKLEALTLENQSLREDGKRLDWLGSANGNKQHEIICNPLVSNPVALRSALDAARNKEGK